MLVVEAAVGLQRVMCEAEPGNIIGTMLEIGGRAMVGSGKLAKREGKEVIGRDLGEEGSSRQAKGEGVC